MEKNEWRVLVRLEPKEMLQMLAGKPIRGLPIYYAFIGEEFVVWPKIAEEWNGKLELGWKFT